MSLRTLVGRLPGVRLLRDRVRARRERRLVDRVAAFYAGILRPGDLVFDVGANVGAWAEAFRRCGARVVAVEPQPACIARLRERFAGDTQVTIVERALGTRAGETVELMVCDQAPTISTLSKRWREQGRFAGEFAWSRSHRVLTATLDDLVREHGTPAYCKIDVEGFEAEVVRGLSRPLPLVSFEFAREFADEAQACLRHLASLGPIEANISLAEDFAFRTPRWEEPEAFLAGLAALPDPLLWGDVYVRSRGA